MSDQNEDEDEEFVSFPHTFFRNILALERVADRLNNASQTNLIPNHDLSPLGGGAANPSIRLLRGVMGRANGGLQLHRTEGLLLQVLMSRIAQLELHYQFQLAEAIARSIDESEKPGPPPATTQDINNLTTVEYNAKTVPVSSCPICLESFKLSQTLKQLPCAHIFCQDCIVNWLQRHGTCPMCREEVKGIAPSNLNRNLQVTHVSDPVVPSNLHRNLQISHISDPSEMESPRSSSSSSNSPLRSGSPSPVFRETVHPPQLSDSPQAERTSSIGNSSFTQPSIRPSMPITNQDTTTRTSSSGNITLNPIRNSPRRPLLQMLDTQTRLALLPLQSSPRRNSLNDESRNVSNTNQAPVPTRPLNRRSTTSSLPRLRREPSRTQRR